MSKPFLGGFVAVAAALIAVGTSGASFYRPSAQTAIAAALTRPQMKDMGPLFPRKPGSRRCRLHGGGPAPGSVAIETCWTIVRFHADGSATVRLMISPPYTETDVGQTWVFRVSRSLHARLVKPPSNLGIGAEA